MTDLDRYKLLARPKLTPLVVLVLQCHAQPNSNIIVSLIDGCSQQLHASRRGNKAK